MNKEILEGNRWFVRVNYVHGDQGIFSFYEVRNCDRWEAERKSIKQFCIDFGSGLEEERKRCSAYAWQPTDEMFKSAKLIQP